jgi:putative phosphoesterase
MKALIISDVHSNIYSLQAIWEKERDSDLIICAGDLVDYGPFPKEVLNWSREHQIICVKGNHDQDIINRYHSGKNITMIPEDARTWVDHNVAQLNEADIDYLENLPEHHEFELDGCYYLVTHMFVKGTYQTMENLHQFNAFWDKHTTEKGAKANQRRIIFGHTHNQAVHYLADNKLWLNPGSTSYRPTRQFEDYSRLAQYMTIDSGQIEIKQLEYDLSPLYEVVKNIRLKDQQQQVAYRFFQKGLVSKAR